MGNPIKGEKMKVFVLGLDGATMDMIEPMVKAGKLPNFARLMKKGVYGPLTSVLPPISAPAWASFMTGKNQGKHGIYSFVDMKPNVLFTSGTSLVTHNHIRTKRLWDLLTEQGKKLIVLNVPITYPPSKIDGVMIPGFDAPSNAPDFYYPPEVKDELQNALGSPYPTDEVRPKDSVRDPYQWVHEYFENEERRKDVVLYLMKSRPWDFFMVVFCLTDKVAHLFWDQEEIMKTTYHKADKLVGDIIQALDDDTCLMLLSDHGTGNMKSFFMTNKWLYDHGYFHINPVTLLNFAQVYKLSFVYATVERVARKFRMTKLLKGAPSRLRRKKIPVPLLRSKVQHLIDWSKTRAYGANFGIYINLKGREPFGIVEPGEEYRKLRDEIIEKIHDIRDPETHEKVVDYTIVKEEIYKGPFADKGPDIIFPLNEMQYAQMNQFGLHHLKYEKPFYPWTDLQGSHRLNGIFFATGPGIKENIPCQDAHLIDLAPTILYLLESSIPRDMDGKVLISCIDEDFLSNRQPSYSDVDETLVFEPTQRDMTKEESDEVRQRLAALGYLE